MCKTSISAKKFIKLYLEVVFYRFIVNMIFVVSGYGEISVLTLIKRCLPGTNIGTGFTGAYLLFYLCIPFINVLIHNISQKQHIYLLLLVSYIYIFLGTLWMCFSVTMNYVSWFIVLYLFASYVRLYPKKIFDDTKIWGILSICFVCVSALSVVICASVNRSRLYAFVTDSNTFLAFATGFCTFMFFKNINVPYNRLINTMAGSTLGVLLIHSNSATMRQWLWVDVLNNVGVYEKSWMPIHAILSVLVIYTVCTFIDYLRIQFVEKPFFKLFDKKWDKIVGRYRIVEDKIFNKLESK